MFLTILFGLGIICVGISSVSYKTPNKSRHFALKSLSDFISSLFAWFSGTTKIQVEPPTLDFSAGSDNDASCGLLTREQVEAKYEPGTSERLAYDDFSETLLAKSSAASKTFPCVYATQGLLAGDHRYVVLRSDDPSEPRNIRAIGVALRRYLKMCRSLGPNTSFVILCGPSDRLKTIEQYNNSFWTMLRNLRIWDKSEWPADVPQDTRDSKWMFCFDSQPIFAVSLTPAHTKRRSRHSAVPIIACQPKWVLDQLLSTPEKREIAQGKVRKLLKEYDQVTISPDLTSYGDAGTSEVKQLCLGDENETVECPYENFDV